MPLNKASTWLLIMRSARNLSQRKLAAKADLTNTAVSEAERKGYASAETWARLAVFFKTSTDAVLWLAGIIHLQAPPKTEIIARIQNELSELDPDVREIAENFISSIVNDK